MKLSACYIVKNEAANLRRSVASIAGAYDELVVVDTGSTDDTVAMVRQLGACVLQVPWQDDFAAARNAALDAATGDYILFLDADEYVSADTAPQLRVLLARELAQADALLLHMLHIDGAEANVIGDTYVLRAMRHLPRLRYVGRIHEELRDNGAPLQHLAVVPDAQLHRQSRKGGGAYLTRSGRVKRIDRAEGTLTFLDGARSGQTIPLADIVELSGERFSAEQEEMKKEETV